MAQRFDQLLNIDPTSLLLVVLRTVVVYLVLLLVLRVAGKRELGQMAPFDLVVLLIISNAVQNSMVGPDTSLNAGLIAAIVLLIMNRFVDSLTLRSRGFRDVLVGRPTVLVLDGVLIPEHCSREGVTEDAVMQALREHGVAELSDVKLGMLEVDGSISVVSIDAQVTRTKRRISGRKLA